MTWPDAAGQGTLRQQVQVPCSGRAAVHRAQHLHIAARVQAEPGRDPPRHDVGHEPGQTPSGAGNRDEKAAMPVAGPIER